MFLLSPPVSKIHPCVLPDLERSEEHTSELQSQSNLVCRLLLEKKNHHAFPNVYRRQPGHPAQPTHSPCPTPHHCHPASSRHEAANHLPPHRRRHRWAEPHQPHV